MPTWLFQTLPNLITVGRLILVPLVVQAIAAGRWAEALGVFLIAGLSDALDGWLAKRFDLRSALGAILDPVADKALLVSIYVTLAAVGVLPLSLALVVVSRDIMIVGAVIISWVMDKPVEIKPLWISKLNTVSQIGFAALALAMKAFDLPAGIAMTAALYSVLALTLASTAAYLKQWLTHMAD